MRICETVMSIADKHTVCGQDLVFDAHFPYAGDDQVVPEPDSVSD